MIIIYITCILLASIAILYLLLGFGLPYGHLSWGGKHKGVLPQKMRVQSLLSIPTILFAIYVLLQIANNTDILLFKIFGYIFLVYFFLNTFLNSLSQSKTEKYIMTPTAFFIFFGFLYAIFFL